MAVVIRLQGLRVTAGTEDIRKFFSGLKIPDGGVHIIGGEREEAFIIFASDEDARRAMARSGHCLKDSPVALLLSSKAEMQSMLEKSTKMAEMEQRRRFEESARPARWLGPEMGRRPGNRSSNSPPLMHQRASISEDGTYMFLRGLPYTVTEKEIHDFFKGLIVEDIAFLKKSDGSNNGAGFVKFATVEDAKEGLNRDRQYIGNRYIEVSCTSLHDWQRTVGRPPVTVSNFNTERDRSPIRNQRNPQNYTRSQSPPNNMLIAPDKEFCVLLENLSFTVEKQDIKKLFQHTKLDDDQILHLMDSEGRRTRSAFVLFRNQRDYCEALSQEKRMFLNRWVNTRPISRENMISLLESHSMDGRRPGNSERFQERSPSFPDDYESERLCVFVRNMPLDVRKVEIIDFFYEFDITENKVSLLYDYDGAGMGKALVLFRSEAEAMRAMALNGQRFLGSEVQLKCISRSQMRQLGVDPPMDSQLPLQERCYSGRNNDASFHSNDEHLDNRMSRGRNIQFSDGQAHRSHDYEPCVRGPRAQGYRGNGSHGNFGPPMQPKDGPTCVQLLNLPFQIRTEEIYDFCYGYRVIPGSVSLQYDQGGKPTGTATIVFESRPEASVAVEELSGRPIGPRKIDLVFV